jgi:protein-S-isoprenylcysteine O-methyltransferase Ste14
VAGCHDVSRLPALGPRGEGWVVIQFVLLAAVAVSGLAGPAWEGAARTVTTVLGAVLLAAGLLLAFRGVVNLRDALTPLPHPRDGASLVDTGSYRLVRHPIYGGIIVGAAGWGLVTASPLALVGAAVLLGFFRLKSAREELWLEARYPGYAAYRARTRRLIPFVY